MLILIVRHAAAGERDPLRYPDDTLRPLTRKGRETHAAVARLLRKRGMAPEAILSSPWKRARQTAGIMARALPGSRRLKPLLAPSLTTAPDLDALKRDLKPAEVARVVALVGHEPWLSELTSLLLTGEPHRLVLDFPKSGVAGIEARELEPGAGLLRFFLRPKMI